MLVVPVVAVVDIATFVVEEGGDDSVEAGAIVGSAVSTATVCTGVQVVMSSSRLVVDRPVAITNVWGIESVLPESVGSGMTSVEIGAPVGLTPT